MAGLATLAYGAFILLPKLNAPAEAAAFQPAFALADGGGTLRTTDEIKG